MSRKSAWLLGIAGSGLVAYGMWRKWQSSMSAGDDAPWNDDSLVNEASEESFPASDAPSHTPMMGSRVLGGHPPHTQ